MAEVVLDGLRAEEERRGDLAVGHALRNEQRDLQLRRREVVGARRLLGARAGRAAGPSRWCSSSARSKCLVNSAGRARIPRHRSVAASAHVRSVFSASWATAARASSARSVSPARASASTWFGAHCTSAGSCIFTRSATIRTSSSSSIACSTRPWVSPSNASACSAETRIASEPSARVSSIASRVLLGVLGAPEGRLDLGQRAEAVREQADLPGLARELDRLARVGQRRLPAPAPEREVRPGGERIDQAPQRGGIARGLDEAVQDELGPVPLLDPDRRVPGHADDLGQGGRDTDHVAREDRRQDRVDEAVALCGAAERRLALADDERRQDLERGVHAAAGQRARARRRVLERIRGLPKLYG